MKTAISIPDELFEEAEELAKRLEKSRSELYRTALQAYIAQHDVDRIREALDRVVTGMSPSENEFVKAASARVLERSEW
jgi:metal-responsive CopG/Arc/MetJ family transcriptional regulator